MTLSELLFVLSEWKKRHGHRSKSTDQQYVIAKYVLASMLGMQWLQEKIDALDSKNSYMRPKPSKHVDIHRHTDRVIQLGEQLFNLQTVQGIEYPLDELKTKSIESTFALLTAAKLLFKARHSFEFVERQHRKGEDYDIRIFAKDDTAISCEVKCKTETRAFSDSTLRASLKAARKQLPKNTPGLVMIMVPEPWLIDHNIQQALPTVLKSIYRNTSRIAGVLFFGEQWNFLEDGSAEHFVHYIHWANERSPHHFLVYNEILSKLTTYESDQQWVYFKDIVTAPDLA